MPDDQKPAVDDTKPADPPDNDQPADDAPDAASADQDQPAAKPARTVPVAELARERAARKKAEDELKKLTDANLSEVEKLRKQVADNERLLTEADARDRDNRVRVAVIGSAARLGFSDGDDAMRLVDRNAIEFDDAGQPTNVEELLGGLLKSKPYLAAAHAKAQGGIDLGNAGAPTFTKDQLAKMTPDQINANWDKIQQSAKSGKLA